jgi:hypothetical protein
MPLLENLGKKQIRAQLDDEFQSAQRVLAELCIKTLAFNDLQSFWELCRNTTLDSPYKVAEDSDSRDAASSPELQDYLSINYAKKAYERLDDPNLNSSLRICAYRDYHRRNFVLKQTMAMKQIGGSSNLPALGPSAGVDSKPVIEKRYKSRYFDLRSGEEPVPVSK